jgi:hypothetical protein
MPTFSKSNRSGKKYSVKTPSGKIVHFGSSVSEHYNDSTGLGAWSHKNHNDEKRRASYLARSSGIKNKSGQLTKNNKESANYYSINYLWLVMMVKKTHLFCHKV